MLLFPGGLSLVIYIYLSFLSHQSDTGTRILFCGSSKCFFFSLFQGLLSFSSLGSRVWGHRKSLLQSLEKPWSPEDQLWRAPFRHCCVELLFGANKRHHYSHLWLLPHKHVLFLQTANSIESSKFRSFYQDDSDVSLCGHCLQDWR